MFRVWMRVSEREREREEKTQLGRSEGVRVASLKRWPTESRSTYFIFGFSGDYFIFTIIIVLRGWAVSFNKTN